MNKIIFIAVISLVLIIEPINVFSQKKSEKKREPLKLALKNLVPNAGDVIVGVYGTNNNFPKPNNELKVYKFKTKGSEMVITLRKLKFGAYALAIYQDVDADGKIDKNFIGIPKEPYAFSNNYHPTVKAPNFDDCKFEYNLSHYLISISMIR